MISVIVPVYNVKPYLKKCLDSILRQSYRDLEILVIDDGSTDGSQDICDDFGKTDERIRVFHTENRGLACARNLGLEHAKGDWIGFIDSDDWIEPDTYECLMKTAGETDADVVECGYILEFAKTSKNRKAVNQTVCGADAVDALIRGEIKEQVWNKLWKRYLFENASFPEGRYYEDIATVYKLIRDARVTGTDRFLYHYVQRKTAISHSHDIRNLTEYWSAHKDRYEALRDQVSAESTEKLFRMCAVAIIRMWAWYLKSEKAPSQITEMHTFTREHYSCFGSKGWPLRLRAGIFLARFNNRFSFAAAYVFNQIYRTFLRPKYC
jgi:glycosyltransferase involved in cell wall biosynthesis